MPQIKYVFFLILTIVGNPFYQMVSYFICSSYNFGSSKGTNVYQANTLVFILILIVIFLVRLLIYTILFSAKKYPFYLKGNNSFLSIFSERHLFQLIGLLSLPIWLSPLEGNVIGFLVFPATILLGSIVSIITFIRLLKMNTIAEKFH